MIAVRVTDDPRTPYVTIAAVCTDCGAELSARTYDARTLDWPTVERNAIADGLRADAHHCGERN
jgi:hypothetical protein